MRTGGYELVLNQATPITLANDKPLPGNRLTTMPWPLRLERQARQGPARRRGWSSRCKPVWDTGASLRPRSRRFLKPLSKPDDEPNRNEQLLAVLGKLKAEVPQVEKGLAGLAAKLGGAVPRPLAETCAA